MYGEPASDIVGSSRQIEVIVAVLPIGERSVQPRTTGRPGKARPILVHDAVGDGPAPATR